MNNARRLINFFNTTDYAVPDEAAELFAPHTLCTAYISDVHYLTAMLDGSAAIIDLQQGAVAALDNPVQVVVALFDVWRNRPESHAWFNEHESRMVETFQRASTMPGGILEAVVYDMAVALREAGL